MKVHLAAFAELKRYMDDGLIDLKGLYLLESYQSILGWQIEHLKEYGSFLLDSGAFTFLNSKKVNVDWYAYADEYADFIVRNKIKRYFELDIDSIVGYDNVLKLRQRIESRTGTPAIPVWHKSRSKEDFIAECKDYDYVSIGGIVTREIPKNIYEKMFPWFIKMAHQNGAKIHGLGYTTIEGLRKYHFDSVDSTCWVQARKFGRFQYFKEGNMTFVNRKLKVKDSKNINYYSFMEWVKFQRYADRNL